MRRLRARTPGIAGLLALALTAAALLAVPAIASARCHGGDPGQGGGPYGGWHHHHHHLFPGSEVGKVASFDTETGQLAITLKNGKTVTGTVTEETFIDCGSFSDYRWDGHGGSGDWGGGDPGQGSCGTEALVPGAVVDGAVTHLEEGGQVFDAIFLAPTTTTPAPPTAS